MFLLICTCINGWVNNCEAGDLKHHRVHYDVTVMQSNTHSVADVTQDTFSEENKFVWTHIRVWLFICVDRNSFPFPGDAHMRCKHVISLQWRLNVRDSVSNHQCHDWFLSRLLRRRSKKKSKLRVTGLYAVNSPVTGEFPAQMASNAENVSIWWRHHVLCRERGSSQNFLDDSEWARYVWSNKNLSEDLSAIEWLR